MTDLRALLLTDVVDSTRLSEALGDRAMAAVWAAHDRAARDLLPLHGGREIDKTDGMLLMFDSAAQAVDYALAYHRALTTLPVPLKARAGLHMGPVILRHNSADDIARGAKPIEVEGLAKPMAARVMALAGGGQLLMTDAARAALDGGGHVFDSHGHWVLKGVQEPVELFEVRAADAAAFDAPPPPVDGDKAWRVVRGSNGWLPLRQVPNNLPQQLTSFVGRERELREVKTLLGQCRLLMLLGMGGLGKTRLSLQVAMQEMHRYPDGVWFLDLAPIRDPALVVHEAARVLGVSEEAGTTLLDTLCAHLKARRVLFIVDNCEHLVQASAEIANAVLRAAPQVRILASSRESLRVPGEQTYPILPLPLPQRGDDAQALARSTAVALFVDRARTHKPGFAITERDAPALGELVARLEGIPLALELAAARLRSLTLADINNRLKDRYKLLTGGGRVLLERQQTLQALVDWSYDLLDDTERRLLARLAVFAGGFDLEAVDAVCATDPLEGDLLDPLTSLVEKSLVTPDERETGMRYRMLETIRDYAAIKLQQSGEAADVRARHCDHYFALAKSARDGLKGPEQAQWIDRAEADLDNIRAAAALALAGGVDPFIAVKLAVAMQRLWILRGYCTEGRKLIDTALALPAIRASDLAQSHALYVGAALAQSQSDHAPARQMLETCLALRRQMSDRYAIAATLSTLSMARLPAGDVEGAMASEHEALQLFRDIGERVGEAIALLHLGQIALYAGQGTQAEDWFGQSLDLARRIEYRGVEGECELGLGQLAHARGDLQDAACRSLRACDISRDAGDKRAHAQALAWHGKVELALGRLDSARACLANALRDLRGFEMREDLVACLEDHAALRAAVGEPALGVNVLAAAALAHERLRVVRSPRALANWQALDTALRERLPAAAHAVAWQEGRRWDLAEATRQCLAREETPGLSAEAAWAA